MADITKKPYAAFLEESLQKINELDPDSILITVVKNHAAETFVFSDSADDVSAASGSVFMKSLIAAMEESAHRKKSNYQDLRPDSEESDDDEDECE